MSCPLVGDPVDYLSVVIENGDTLKRYLGESGVTTAQLAAADHAYPADLYQHVLAPADERLSRVLLLMNGHPLEGTCRQERLRISRIGQFLAPKPDGQALSRSFLIQTAEDLVEEFRGMRRVADAALQTTEIPARLNRPGFVKLLSSIGPTSTVPELVQDFWGVRDRAFSLYFNGEFRRKMWTSGTFCLLFGVAYLCSLTLDSA